MPTLAPFEARFEDFSGAGTGFTGRFRDPVQMYEARTIHAVGPLLDAAAQAVRDGLWVVVGLAFEAGPAFDPAFSIHPPQLGIPLAVAAAYRERLSPAPRQTAHPLQAGPIFEPSLDRAAWRTRMNRIHNALFEGEVYQINATFPLLGHSERDPLDMFYSLGERFRPGYALAWNMGDHDVVSLSPELFFRLDGRALLARPMKGTAKRASDPKADAAVAQALAADPKSRAENVMIVDLLRNDLGRIAVAGSVTAGPLFETRAFGGVWQMTSDVRANLAPGLTFVDVLAALFPCGSITGAPKIRATEIIRETETGPRGFYTGAFGFVAPNGDALFNVAIRTLEFGPAANAPPNETSRPLRFGVGAGIVWDSDPDAEYAECLLKAGLLKPDFRLLETMRLTSGRLWLLEEHLIRLAASARELGFRCDLAAIRDALDRIAVGAPLGLRKLRLLLAADGEIEIDASPLPPLPSPLRIGLARTPVESDDLRLRFKTDRRELYDRAKAERPDCDEALLVNERGELVEGSFTTLFLNLDGRLVTPTTESGPLPGVLRGRLLRLGIAREARLYPADLVHARRIWMGNSVRGLRAARYVDRFGAVSVSEPFP